MSSSPTSESDSSISESTQAFNDQVAREFVRAFPLNSELRRTGPARPQFQSTFISARPPQAQQQQQSTATRTPGGPLSSFASGVPSFLAPKTPKMVDLDDSLAYEHKASGASIQSLSAKNIELTATLENAKQKIARLERDMKSRQEEQEKRCIDFAELTRANSRMKSRMLELEEEARSAEDRVQQGPLQAQLEMYRSVAAKQHVWIQWKDAQLSECARVLLHGKLWTRETRQAIRRAYRLCAPEELTEAEAYTIAPGSVQEDFMGIDGLDDTRIEEEDSNDSMDDSSLDVSGRGMDDDEQRASQDSNPREESNPNETTIRGDESALFYESAVERHEDEREPAGKEYASVLEVKSYAKDISLEECERDDELLKLEVENERMKEQLVIERGRVGKLLVVRETNADLTRRLEYTQGELTRTLRELEILRSKNIENMVKAYSPDTRTPSETRGAIRDKMEAERKDRQIDSAIKEKLAETQRANRAEEEKAALERRLNDLSDWATERDEIQTAYATLLSQFDALTESARIEGVKKQEREQELASLTGQLETARAELARHRAASTDAGDTTQILHMPWNPLEREHAEWKEQEDAARKRIVSAGSDGEGAGPSSKRGKTEDDAAEAKIEELGREISRLQRQNERAVQIQTDLARQFKSMTMKVLGFEIKMKTDELVHVVSTLDTARQDLMFEIKREDNSINLLELPDQPSPTVQERFAAEAQEWIGMRSSVPGFLAAVQMKLAASRWQDDTLMATMREDETLGGGAGTAGGTYDPLPSFSILRED